MEVKKVNGDSGLHQIVRGWTGISEVDWIRFSESLNPIDREPTTEEEITTQLVYGFRAALTNAIREREEVVEIRDNCPSDEYALIMGAYARLKKFLDSKGARPVIQHERLNEDGLNRHKLALVMRLSVLGRDSPERAPDAN